MSIMVRLPTTAPILRMAPIMMTAPSPISTFSRMMAPGSIRALRSFRSSRGTPEFRAPWAMCSASSPTATRQSMRALPRHSPTPVCRAGAKGPSSNMSPSTATLYAPRALESTSTAARMDWGLAL